MHRRKITEPRSIHHHINSDEDTLIDQLDPSMPSSEKSTLPKHGPSSSIDSKSRSKYTSLMSSASSLRAFLLILIVLVLILISRTVAPTDHSPFHHQTHKIELIPKDYLNASSQNPAPFEFCPHYGPGDALAQKYGAANLARSKLYTGSGARIQKVIHRALSGLPVTISVLGGSISACHGAGDNPIAPHCYPSIFFDWWNSVFPHPASELTNGAMRRTDSAYFSFCSGHHLPDQTDLVILEFDSDDPYDDVYLDHFDLLVRSILLRADQPAVLILGHFAPQTHGVHGYNDPASLHTTVAQFYDVPHIATKGVIFSDFLSNPLVRQPSAAATSPTYWVDPVLANTRGHELLADVLITYFQEMTCKGWDAALGHGFEVPVVTLDATAGHGAGGLFGGVGARKGGPDGAANNRDSVNAKFGDTANIYASLRIPPMRLNNRIEDSKDFREPSTFCVSANDLINPLPPSLFYGSGWHAQNPSGSNTGSPDAAGAQGYYWYSTIPMSKLRVPVKLASGDVAIYYLAEPRATYAGKGQGPPGVLCWVDDNVNGAVEISGVADVGAPTPMMRIIDRGVQPGSHFVECQLMGEEGGSSPAFKILGIFAT